MKPTKHTKPEPQVPAAVTLGLSSTKDFPPLAAPQPVAPPRVQRKATTANTASPAIKPVVPVLSSQQPRNVPSHKEASDIQASPKKDQPILASSSAQSDKTIVEPVHKAKTKVKTSTPETANQQRPNTRPKAPLSLVVPGAKGANFQAKLDQKTSAAAAKRQRPGKLDISAAKEDSKEDSNVVATSSVDEKPSDTNISTAPIDSRPATPATPATPAAVVSHALGPSTRQTQSRNIRVLPTSVAETPPRLPSASPSVASVAPPLSAAKRQPSRRGSFASIQLPGTPMSERISDNASYTSASMSRANSPPPIKVGSAPIRPISKSQQKKERQARAKFVEESSKTQEASVSTIAEKPEQAPIVGRKKKAKKTATSGTADSTPTVTRPPSPTPNEDASQGNAPAFATSKSKGENPKAQRDRIEAETPASPGISSGGDQKPKNPLTAASILSKLQKSGDISPTILNIFKGVAGANYRFELSQADFACAESETGPIFTAAQARQINEGDAIKFEYPPNKRLIILPDRRVLRGFNAEQAERYLDLRKRILSHPEATAFHPPRNSIDRYLHAAPQRGRSVKVSNPSGSDQSMGLDNRFVSPPLIQASTSTMPAYWSASPLSEESIARRATVMGVDEAEQAMLSSRKETEVLEKKLNALLKRNRKLVFGNIH